MEAIDGSIDVSVACPDRLAVDCDPLRSRLSKAAAKHVSMECEAAAGEPSCGGLSPSMSISLLDMKCRSEGIHFYKHVHKQTLKTTTELYSPQVHNVITDTPMHCSVDM